jgi:hypothetical protein
MWQGKLLRESTKQGNNRVVRQIEAAHRTSLAKGEVGISEKKPSPTSLGQRNMVDVTGIEPVTPCLQSRCSPS